MIAGAIIALWTAVAGESDPKPPVDNVIVVMADGLRWQEVFDGCSDQLLYRSRDHGSGRFASQTQRVRRERLMPFMWTVIARDGQIYGNRLRGSTSRVLNAMKISYPGYNETLVGYPDPSIVSNFGIPNPNVTVFEWLHRKPPFKGRAAAFGAWKVISAIFNKNRCGFLTNSGYEPWTWPLSNPVIDSINRMKVEQTRYWRDQPSDVFPFQNCIEYMKLAHPRLLYISLGETDAWAHEDRYGLYLDATRRFDHYLQSIWETAQTIGSYKGRTALIVTTDHGRGDGVKWTSHGQTVPNAEFTWQAYLGPGIRPLGEISNAPEVTNGQVAATIARLLGYDYNAAQPKAAAPISSVISGP